LGTLKGKKEGALARKIVEGRVRERVSARKPEREKKEVQSYW